MRFTFRDNKGVRIIGFDSRQISVVRFGSVDVTQGGSTILQGVSFEKEGTHPNYTAIKIAWYDNSCYKVGVTVHKVDETLKTSIQNAALSVRIDMLK